MKILYTPLDYHRHSEDDRLFGDMLRAFQKQSQCVIYNGNITEAINFKPDSVFYQGSLSKEDCIKIKTETKCKWTTWTGDVRYAPLQYLVEAAEFTDKYFFPFSGDLLKTYRKLLDRECNFIFEPLQNWRFRSANQINSGDITFVGNRYEHLPGGIERAELKDLSEKIRQLKCYGSGYSLGQINNYDVPMLYNNSYAVIAENNWSDIEDYFTPRNLGAMAAGSCCLMKVFPGIENHFENWKHCIYYRHQYELIDIINFINANPEVRNRIAKSGYELVKKKYSMDNFVKQYISQL